MTEKLLVEFSYILRVKYSFGGRYTGYFCVLSSFPGEKVTFLALFSKPYVLLSSKYVEHTRWIWEFNIACYLLGLFYIINNLKLRPYLTTISLSACTVFGSVSFSVLFKESSSVKENGHQSAELAIL